MKALAVSRRDPDAWVLGADQTLAFAGGLVSKAPSLADARARLAEMRGRPHQLHSGAALAHPVQPLPRYDTSTGPPDCAGLSQGSGRNPLVRLNSS